MFPSCTGAYRDIPDFELQAADTICRVCAAYGIGTVNMNQTLVTRRFCDTLAAHGLGISVWTVDWPEEMEWFFTYGVRNVTHAPAAGRADRSAARLNGRPAPAAASAAS